MNTRPRSTHRLQQTLLFLLVYTLVVILWGAWVRISHSGDGCGESWPLCKGVVLPQGAYGKTGVEYGHRLMSGFFGIFVVFIFVWVRKIFPAGHGARRWALWALFFTITEALLGAKLVLAGLVTDNQSYLRTLTMSLHQINSLLLTGSVYLLWESSFLTRDQKFEFKTPWLNGLLLLIATTGSWASLASTLFPSDSLLSGLAKDFAFDSHHTLRLRVFHPLAGVLLGGGIGMYFLSRQRNLFLLFAGGVLFGILTLLLLSPTWMKIAHLGIAHLLWMSLLRWSVRRE